MKMEKSHGKKSFQRLKWSVVAVLMTLFIMMMGLNSFAAQKDVHYKTIYSNTASGEISLNIQNWRESGKFEQGFILGDDGIYSMKLDMRQSSYYNGGYHEMVLPRRMDISDVISTGELRLKLKIETDDPTRTAADVNIYFKTYDDATPAWANSARVKIPDADNITADGEWHEVSIPLSSFVPGNINFDTSKIASIAMDAVVHKEDKYFFYFRDMEVYDIKNSATLEFESCSMNNEGMFSVKALSSSVLDEATSPEKFSIGGIKACDIVITGKSVELIFDMQPEFPSEFTVNIENGVMSEDELETDQTEFVGTALEIQNGVFALIESNPSIEGGTVSAEAKITAISVPEQSLKAKVMFLVLDGEKIVDVDMAETKELVRGEYDTLAFSGEVTNETINPRAEFFFFSSDSARTPLAPMQSFKLD